MGSVHRAFDRKLRRHVALKFLRNDMPRRAAALLREAQAQAGIDHPNICKVFDVGELEGRPYVAMQFVAGETLDRAAARMTVAERVRVMEQVAQAMSAAHRLGRFHCDLKPGNVLVERGEDGVPKPYVVDFGIARVPDAGERARAGGTPQYMAPEQVRGDDARIDRRTDVYGLGATLYEVLAGRPPRDGLRGDELREGILGGDVKRPRAIVPSLPADLEAIVLKCLEREPDRRYDSARALAEDLGRFLDGEPILARATSLRYRLGKRLRRHRALAAVSVAAIALVAALGVSGLRERARARELVIVAQRFGEDAAQVEALMRTAYLLPTHDLRREREQARERMRHIESEMARIGPAADGAGHAALGRAHLALGDPAEARAHLDAAWRAGRRAPGLASALGRAWAALYEKARVEADTATGTEREARRQAVDREYREVTLEWLRRSAEDPEGQADLLAAEIALVERRAEEAQRHAEQAAARAPDLFEAREAEGRAWIARAVEAIDAGRRSEADRLLGEADRSLSAGLALARSHPGLHARRCDVAHRRVHLAFEVPADEERRRFDAAIEVCGSALRVTPGDPDVHVGLMLVRFQWAQNRSYGGDDPSQALDEAQAAAEHARDAGAEPRRFEPILAFIHEYRAHHRLERGEDPSSELALAIQHARRAAELSPTHYTSQRGVTSTLIEQATFDVERGADPRPALDEAIAAAGRAAAINVADYDPWNDRAYAYRMKAEWEMEHGEDPGPSLQAGLSLGLKAAEMAKEDALPPGTVSDLYTAQAEHEIASGRDASASIEGAIRYAERAIAAEAESADGHVSMAGACLSKARFEIARRGDPAPWLEKALAAALAAVEHEGGSGARDRLAEVWIARGRFEIERGRSAEKAAAEALAALSEVPGHGLSVRLRRAEALLLSAVASRAKGAAAKHLESARIEIDEATRVDPRSERLRRLSSEHQRWAGSPGAAR